MQLTRDAENRPTGWNLMAAVFALVLLTGGFRSLQAQDADEDPSDPPPAEEPVEENPFPDRPLARSLEGGTEWFNTSAEISIEELRGKVVLLDFWTYCCINCIHVLPDLKYLEEKYADQLVVIGVHYAKFDNEKDSENIRNAIVRYEIEHPVVNDSDGVIATNYRFSAWPQRFLIDPEGRLIGYHKGEGDRELFDALISRMVEYHRKKGTLDETPVRFDLERDRVKPGALKYPGKLLADEAGGRLFISDSNHNRIVVSSLDGQLLDVIGTGDIGADDGPYDQATFDHPQGMELVGNTLYVADTENHLIRAIDLQQRTVATLAGTGVQARARLPGGPLKEIALNSPWALRHLDGTLYIAMAGPHQLWKHELGGETIEQFAGSGREDVVDGPLEYSALAQPSGITTDGEVLYHVDSEGSAIRKVTLGDDGEVTTIVGPHDVQGALFEFGDIDGVGDEVRLQHPIGLVYHDGFIYVADSYNHRIKRIHPKTRVCEAWLGTGESGVALDPPQLFEPSGLAAAGNTLYIADTNNHRIVAADLETAAATEFTVEGLQPPAPVEREPVESDEPEALEVAAHQVKPGESLRFTIDFELPEGFKLNKLGPVGYTLRASGDQQLVAAEHLDARSEATKGEMQATIEVPLASAEGTGRFELLLSYTFCREGTGGVCRFDRQKWSIPVEVAADAEAEELKLTASPGRE